MKDKTRHLIGFIERPFSPALRSAALVLFALLPLYGLSGCARGGPSSPAGPQTVIDFYARYNGPVNDAFYYFFAIDADGNFGVDGPLPVAAGPYWENGWGTGSITHFVEYHQGQYTLNKVNLEPTLTTPGGGIVAASGVAQSSAVGTATLTVQTVTLGTVAVGGSGMVQSVTNNGFQAAGALTLQTNAAGQTVAGSVVFTPAPDGGRALTASEQAAVDALNAGGVALAADSLSALHLTLNLGAPQAGSQVLAIAATVGSVQNSFTSSSTGQTTVSQATVTANSTTATANPPLPGITLTTNDLVQGGSATVALDFSTVATVLGPPYNYTLPAGGNTLQATVNLANLGDNVQNLSVNFISVIRLIFDPTITDPNQHTYDGLGLLGNRYVTFRTNQFQTINNSSGLFEQEQANDPTLTGPNTQQDKNSVDLVDWSITIRSLQ